MSKVVFNHHLSHVFSLQTMHCLDACFNWSSAMDDVPKELLLRGNNIEERLMTIEEAKTFHVRAAESGLFDESELTAIGMSIDTLVTECDNERTELAAAIHVWQNDIDRIKQEINQRQTMIDECPSVMEHCPNLMDTLAAGQARRIQKLEAAQKSIGVQVKDNRLGQEEASGGALETIAENSTEKENQ